MGGQLSQRVNSVRKKEKGKPKKTETKEEAEERIEKEGARVMTLHSSKGLEFDYVWIAGCSQGTLPSKQGILEEERRLMYVGMTRAKKDLTMSFVVSDLCPRSQFLEETGIR
jgi:superfamily I DNA/RNA helicase